MDPLVGLEEEGESPSTVGYREMNGRKEKFTLMVTVSSMGAPGINGSPLRWCLLSWPLR